MPIHHDLEERVASTTRGCLNCGASRDPDVADGHFCSTECGDTFTRALTER